ncbi:MAG: hypothetical protein R2821_05100 [Flavobacteriaceae bacterium]|jgi:ABC-type antimicrobial peptide transport system permease subunit|nr:hypothetical protein [Flavobacteriaceae bacterium]MCB0486737.1 hypothetical protein [Flavobacteriaceae bacterium]
MFRRAIPLLFGCIFLVSCEYFSSTNSASQNADQQLDTIIDLAKVDVYPIFYDCEDYSEESDQKECFEASLSKRLSELLNKNDLKVKKVVNDTTYINLFIDNKGKASVVSINSPQNVKEQLPQLDSIIENSVDSLQKIKPAVKRGILVNSQYKLAIIIKTI